MFGWGLVVIIVTIDGGINAEVAIHMTYLFFWWAVGTNVSEYYVCSI